MPVDRDGCDRSGAWCPGFPPAQRQDLRRAEREAELLDTNIDLVEEPQPARRRGPGRPSHIPCLLLRHGAGHGRLARDGPVRTPVAGCDLWELTPRAA